MLEAIPITEARQKLLPLLSKIEEGAYRFMVTRHGKPLAVVINYEDYNRMTETLKLIENRSWAQRIDAGLVEAREGRLIDINKGKVRHV
jgi:antitoxin YefM